MLEEELRTHLRYRPGVELRLGHRATTLTQDADGVTVAVQDGQGDGYEITARYVLGCDGAGGVVREQAGARYAGRCDPRPNFNMVFSAPALDTALGAAVQYWVVGAAVTGVIGRLDLDGTWWAILPGVEADYGAAHAAELITGLVGAPVEHRVLATDPWTARMLVADTFRDRRVFLVGESAHVNPPWGGHGFNTCVGDAVNIAWKIAAVEQGWAPATCWRATSRNAAPWSSRPWPARRPTCARWPTCCPGRGADPARQAGRVPQPGARPRLQLRRLAGHPAGAPMRPARAT